MRGVTLLSGGGLLLVVLGAATVAMLAEFAKTWRWYFRMEQAMALAMPATLVLLGLFVVGLVGMVVLAGRD
ncbi:hypothetical protein DU500_15565 [Haloplanus rubicundus]|uniref:Uncharacterized protein n=2 Tax=Haloplanus rubicundus TaxID=1547898 RepID=A0A345E6A8_9EURY|nr:hypothetical protein DU500_15565 [Haloplanus rubicundus]AXG11148.1 hypothetical protein DU484_15545 [Haloplanus rubicundus]